MSSGAIGAEAIYLDRVIWTDASEMFGGFSGIEVSGDGQGFTVISDRGYWTSGRFLRSGDRLTGVSYTPLQPLQDLQGLPVEKFRIDAEGLAIADDGTVFVSFEGAHRVWKYAGLNEQAQRAKHHEAFKALQNNSGLEALAIDAGGVLYTLPERSGDWERPFPVYRSSNGSWAQPFSIPRRDKYLPVGADFGPDGRFYLLERDFVWYKGFSSRIRRFELTGAGFVNEEVLLTSGFGEYDNLEGIAAWRDSAGAVRLIAVSDDNFNILQTSQFVEFLVRETP